MSTNRSQTPRGSANHTSNTPEGHYFSAYGATPLATQAALARSDTLGFVRLVRLLPLRRRQTGIVRGFRRLAELCFEIGNQPLGRPEALPQDTDQGVLLGVAQVVEVGKLGHAPG